MVEHLPEKADQFKTFFHSKGAYSRFKELLGNCNALERWFEFERVRTESALKDWCTQNNINIEEGNEGGRIIGSTKT
jgi:hypothetical protein